MPEKLKDIFFTDSTISLFADIISTRFPVFDGQSDATVTLYLEDALCIFKLCDRAVIYLAAHLCSLDIDQSGNTGIDSGLGEITSEKIGQKAVTYKTQASVEKDVFYTTTKYGRMFLQLRDKCPSRAFTPRVL